MEKAPEQPFLGDLKAIDTYVFDYGGVVSFHYCEPWQGNIGKILKIDPKQAKALLSESSPQGSSYRLGHISREEFWTAVFEKAGVTDVDMAELENNWANSYQIDQRMLEVMQRLRHELQCAIGILSNSDKYRQEHIESTYGLSGRVDFIVSSYQHGVIKPEKEAYLKTLEVAGRVEAPEKVLYIDDRAGHVASAAALGLQGYVFSTYEQFLQLLKEHNLLS
jgi:HAD superfamily hydrolase (TIGR01509 family)